MELYKLRYNLYNYIFDSNIDYKLLVVSKNIAKYFLIAIFVFFIIIIINDTSKISYIIFFFILFGLILIYLTFIIDSSFDVIKTDKKFIDYCIYFRLFNCIFIDSYKNNDIPIYIKNDEYPDITKKTLTNIIDESISKISDIKYYNSSSLLALPTTKSEKLDVYNKVKNSSFLSLSEFTGKQISSYYKDSYKNNDNIEYYNNYLYSDTPIDFTEYLKFKSGVSYLYLNIPLTVRILIVGGGGGGATRTDEFKFGGGGGGGQVKEELNFSLEIGFYQITVGNGGGIGENGGISSIRKRDESNKTFTIDIIIAGGGGAGISSVSETKIESGTGGGGGGNSFKIDVITLGGKAKVIGEDTSKKSADGGNGNSFEGIGYLAGGGGGGIPILNYNPLKGIQGNGGIGMNSDITGTEIGYGGGGGGGRDVKTSSAGYGGGNGGGYSQTGRTYTSIDPIPGTPNTGGGGGGYCHKIAGQLSATGGSGVVIIRFLNQSTSSKNNIYIPKEKAATDINNSIIIANTNENLEEINIVKYSITKPSSEQYNIYLEYLKNRDETQNLNQELNKVYNKIYEYVNEYYNTYNDIIELLEVSSVIKVDYKYLYSINLNTLELKKNKSGILKNLYDLLKEYFIKKLTTSPVLYTTKEGTDRFQNILINESDNNYLNTFYNTLMEINTNIKYNDNIGKDDIYTYSDDLIKSNSILKFIDINNDNKYRLLKKWIFIKIDEDNDFHKEIKNNYTSNKDLYIYDVNNEDTITVSAVVKDISSIYINSGTLKYFLIDIETINKYLREKNKEDNNYNLSINAYIINIYKTLLNNYNYRIDLNNTLQNFDILFDVNKDIDKEVNILINNYLYYYNLIIVIVIIIMTIILHIFYIELFRLI